MRRFLHPVSALSTCLDRFTPLGISMSKSLLKEIFMKLIHLLDEKSLESVLDTLEEVRETAIEKKRKKIAVQNGVAKKYFLVTSK